MSVCKITSSHCTDCFAGAMTEEQSSLATPCVLDNTLKFLIAKVSFIEKKMHIKLDYDELEYIKSV